MYKAVNSFYPKVSVAQTPKIITATVMSSGLICQHTPEVLAYWGIECVTKKYNYTKIPQTRGTEKC